MCPILEAEVTAADVTWINSLSPHTLTFELFIGPPVAKRRVDPDSIADSDARRTAPRTLKVSVAPGEKITLPAWCTAGIRQLSAEGLIMGGHAPLLSMVMPAGQVDARLHPSLVPLKNTVGTTAGVGADELARRLRELADDDGEIDPIAAYVAGAK